MLIGVQGTLYAYILTLLPSFEAAQDVLQETNLVLWSKRDEFQLGTNFFAWCCRTAEFKALSWLRGKQRDHLTFGDNLMETLATEAVEDLPELTQRLPILRRCVGKLSERDQGLLKQRYVQGASVKSLAVEVGKTVNAISRSLYRIRALLLDCMNRSSLEAPHGR